jgi:hypothetical protein
LPFAFEARIVGLSQRPLGRLQPEATDREAGRSFEDDMNRLALLLLLFVAGQSTAAICPPKEYAELKDQAKASTGLIHLRGQYCIADLGKRYAQLQSDVDGCERLKSQISTILEDAGDSEGLLYAMNGCNGPSPAQPRIPSTKRK